TERSSLSRRESSPILVRDLVFCRPRQCLRGRFLRGRYRTPWEERNTRVLVCPRRFLWPGSTSIGSWASGGVSRSLQDAAPIEARPPVVLILPVVSLGAIRLLNETRSELALMLYLTPVAGLRHIGY